MIPPYEHQVEGAARICGQPFIWIGDGLGAGKTRQVVMAAEELHSRGEVDQVLVAAPAQVWREQWYDPVLGQLAAWSTRPHEVRAYRPRSERWEGGGRGAPLKWIVTSYEYARRDERIGALVSAVSRRTMLVLDESLAVKARTSETTKAMWRVRQRCGRVVLLNGTEGGGDTPADLYAQAKMMSPAVLQCSTWAEYQARYAVMNPYVTVEQWVLDPATGRKVKRPVPVAVDRWVNLDDLWRRLAPYYLRRTVDHLLPERIPPTSFGATLKAETWRLYREMRADALAVLDLSRHTAAPQAGVKALRLAQLASGFVGGVVDDNDDFVGAVEVSREKRAALLDQAADWLREDKDLRLAVWCRFRHEAERAAEELRALFPEVGLLVGGQGDDARAHATQLLNPRTAGRGPAAMAGTIRAGALGLDLHAAGRAAYLSNEWSHVARTQSEGRHRRLGMRGPVHVHDFLAAGPRDERTVDHTVVGALKNKANLAAWGEAEWRRAIEEGI